MLEDEFSAQLQGECFRSTHLQVARLHALHDHSLHTSRVSPVMLSQMTILHKRLPERAWDPVVGSPSLRTRLAVDESFFHS
jgi:hypothetical protein